MARLTQAFNAAAHVPETSQDRDFAPLPDGWYRLKVTEADLRENSQRTGTYIKLRFDVLGPTHQGRVLFSNITNEHATSRKAEAIGRDQLDVLCKAGGIALLDDTDLLLGITVEGRVAQSEYQGKAGNEIKGYRVPADLKGQAPRPAWPAAAPAAPAPSGSKPPWAR